MLVVGVLVGGLAIGGAATYVGTGAGGISAKNAGEMVASTLEKSSDADYEVVNVEKESGLYRVQLNSQGTLSSYYLTQDGNLLSAGMTDINQVRTTLDQQNNVEQCLDNKNTRLYGNITQVPTQTQIQVLGGAQAVSDYYVDVNAPANLQQAANQGVSSVPTLVVNNETLTDVNNLTQIQEFANCN